MSTVQERRHKKDVWSKLLIGFNVSAWLLLLVILLVFHRAQPEFETFFDRFFNLTLRTFWDIRYVYLLVYCVILGIVVSMTGLVISLFRARRKTDHLASLVIMCGVSLVLLLVALYHI